MQIELVVFDMAGTTVADDGAVAKAFQQAMYENGYNIPAEKINPLMGYKKPEAIKKILQEYETDSSKISEKYIAEIHNRFIDVMLEHYKTSDEVKAMPGAEDVFIYLKNNDIKVALNTGFSRNIADAIVDRLSWKTKGLIDFVAASDEVPAGRPHPYMIEKIMSEANIDDAKKVIKVGDTEVDINEGKNAGCLYSIAVTTGAFTADELLPYKPSFILNHLSELIPIVEGMG